MTFKLVIPTYSLPRAFLVHSGFHRKLNVNVLNNSHVNKEAKVQQHMLQCSKEDATSELSLVIH